MKKFALTLITTVSTFASDLFAADPFGEALSGVTETAEKAADVPAKMVGKLTETTGMFSFAGTLNWLEANWMALVFGIAAAFVLLVVCMFVLGRLSSRKRR